MVGHSFVFMCATYKSPLINPISAKPYVIITARKEPSLSTPSEPF